MIESNPIVRKVTKLRCDRVASDHVEFFNLTLIFEGGVGVIVVVVVDTKKTRDNR